MLITNITLKTVSANPLIPALGVESAIAGTGIGLTSGALLPALGVVGATMGVAFTYDYLVKNQETLLQGFYEQCNKMQISSANVKTFVQDLLEGKKIDTTNLCFGALKSLIAIEKSKIKAYSGTANLEGVSQIGEGMYWQMGEKWGAKIVRIVAESPVYYAFVNSSTYRRYIISENTFTIYYHMYDITSQGEILRVDSNGDPRVGNWTGGANAYKGTNSKGETVKGFRYDGTGTYCSGDNCSTREFDSVPHFWDWWGSFTSAPASECEVGKIVGNTSKDWDIINKKGDISIPDTLSNVGVATGDLAGLLDGVATGDIAVDDVLSATDSIAIDTATGEVIDTATGEVIEGAEIPPTAEKDSHIRNYLVDGLENIFPFCLPFDIYKIFTSFIATPKAPAFTWVFTGWNGQKVDIDVDLSVFDSVAEILRTMELIAFIVGLCVMTRRLIE